MWSAKYLDPVSRSDEQFSSLNSLRFIEVKSSAFPLVFEEILKTTRTLQDLSKVLGLYKIVNGLRTLGVLYR